MKKIFSNLSKIFDKMTQEEILDQENNGISEPEASQEVFESEALEGDDIQKLKNELEETKDKYLRLYAEFDNYKKRTLKEKLEMMKTAAQETIVSLLPVIDDFDRAKKAADEGKDQFSEGVMLVYQKLHNNLALKGLKAMESNGEDFNPEYHEAITEIPAPEMAGKVIDTTEKGYLLHDKIIRYAKVVVGK